MPVDTPRSDYLKFAPQWKRLRDTYDGRDAVLHAGKSYAPDLPGADSEGNRVYRERGNFYNAVQRTVFGMVGMLFSKDVQIKFPERYKSLLDDITLTCISTEMFTFTASEETFLMGRYGILVDMQDQTEGVKPRPYVVGYAAEDMISWSVERGYDGTLSRVILRECKEGVDPNDPYVQQEFTQYRVLSLDSGVYSQQIWRKQPGDDKYTPYGEPLVPTRRGSPLSFIPFIFLGPLHVTPQLVKSPLLDLADVNLGHWRNSCDYEQGLHLVALPTPWVAGMKAAIGSSPDAPMKIGPSVVWELDVQGKAGMVEFAGHGMDALMKAMEEKKAQMASLGARLMEATSSRYQETATAIQMRHAGDFATLRSLAISIGQGLTMTLQMLAWWMDTIDKPEQEDASIELNKDFLSIKMTSLEVLAALQSVQAGKISFETFWHIMLTGGWAREGITAEDEMKQITKEEPMLPKVDPTEVMPGQKPQPKPGVKPGKPGAKPKPASSSGGASS